MGRRNRDGVGNNRVREGGGRGQGWTRKSGASVCPKRTYFFCNEVLPGMCPFVSCLNALFFPLVCLPVLVPCVGGEVRPSRRFFVWLFSFLFLSFFFPSLFLLFFLFFFFLLCYGDEKENMQDGVGGKTRRGGAGLCGGVVALLLDGDMEK